MFLWFVEIISFVLLQFFKYYIVSVQIRNIITENKWNAKRNDRQLFVLNNSN